MSLLNNILNFIFSIVSLCFVLIIEETDDFETHMALSYWNLLITTENLSNVTTIECSYLSIIFVENYEPSIQISVGIDEAFYEIIRWENIFGKLLSVYVPYEFWNSDD